MGGALWVGRARAEISFKIGLDAAQIVVYYQGVPLEPDADASASAGSRGAWPPPGIVGSEAGST